MLKCKLKNFPFDFYQILFCENNYDESDDGSSGSREKVEATPGAQSKFRLSLGLTCRRRVPNKVIQTLREMSPFAPTNLPSGEWGPYLPKDKGIARQMISVRT